LSLFFSFPPAYGVRKISFFFFCPCPLSSAGQGEGAYFPSPFPRDSRWSRAMFLPFSPSRYFLFYFFFLPLWIRKEDSQLSLSSFFFFFSFLGRHKDLLFILLPPCLTFSSKSRLNTYSPPLFLLFFLEGKTTFLSFLFFLLPLLWWAHFFRGRELSLCPPF